jgi:hypothetical protein
VALVIGVLQLLNLILAVKPDLHGPFWDGVGVAGDHYDIIGGAICGSFLVFGILSVILYKPWRRMIDRKRELRWENEVIDDDQITPATPPYADYAPESDGGQKLGRAHVVESAAGGSRV